MIVVMVMMMISDDDDDGDGNEYDDDDDKVTPLDPVSCLQPLQLPHIHYRGDDDDYFKSLVPSFSFCTVFVFS